VVSATGSVNTVILEERTWRGFDTDGPGVLARLQKRLTPRGRRVAVVGAGGTARAVAWTLADAGCRVTLFNRTAERGAEAARALGVSSSNLEGLPEHDWDILVNATPLGRDGERIIDPDRLRGSVVIDAVYGPRPTALVSDARDRGLEVIDGLEMLAAQGVLQFRHLTGVGADYEVFHAAAIRHGASGGS
jgi:shikimate dehydrogenase